MVRPSTPITKQRFPYNQAASHSSCHCGTERVRSFVRSLDASDGGDSTLRDLPLIARHAQTSVYCVMS